jgi:uncharacterized membrane protein YgaE (UPF0421/DUF939 family)
MKPFKEYTGLNLFLFIEYIIKCLAGVAVGYFLYQAFPQQDDLLYWVLLSIVLSITHDNNNKVAYDRMRGNIAGSATGLLCYFLHTPPNFLTISIGVVLTIVLCSLLKLINVSRIALVAFMIVIIYQGDHNDWQGALYRMLSVMAGCLIGLGITYVFSLLSRLVLSHNR